MRLPNIFIVSIIIAVITIVLLTNVIIKIKEASAEEAAKQTCKISVQTQAKSKLRYADFSGEIKCPTVKLEIKDKSEDAVKKKLADAMYDCWDQFGRGKLELFLDDSVYCAICHRITFGDDAKISGFKEYLATNNAPGQKISYLQFLTTEQTQNSDFLKELENKKIDDAIDASENSEYAIVFTYIKGKKYLEEYAKKAAYTAPGAGLMIFGAGLVWYSGPIAAVVAASSGPFAPVTGPAAWSMAVTAGTISFGIGYVWSTLALKYAGVPFEHIALVSFIPYDAQSLQDLNCRELPIKQ